MSGRCKSCDAILSSADMCRKHAETGEYFDLCGRCLKEVISIVPIPIHGEPVNNFQVSEDTEGE